MVDLTVTATSVLPGADAVKALHNAGETIAAGKVVARSSAGLIMLADSNSATAELRAPVGIALNGGAIGQPIQYQRSGDITIGATLVAGTAYYLSDTPGGIAPVADVGSGEYPTILGIAKSTTVLDINIQSAGVAI